MMIIKISNLSEGIHHLEFDENVKNIGIDEPFFGNVNVKVELSKLHNQIILQADISANASFICDRCTKDFNTVLSSNYKMVYLFGSEPEDNNDISVTFLPMDTDKIILDEDVRDYAVLSVPMKKLCKEDCKGLCVNCGKDLNEGDCGCQKNQIDSRWLPLMELKDKINNN